MGKFRILFKNDPEVEQHFEEHKGPNWLYGVSLDKLEKCQTPGGETCYALCCEGSWLSELIIRFKFWNYATILRGW